MRYTENFRRQHDAILAKAADVAEAARTLANEADAAQAANRLAQLNGIVQVHLAAEDKTLYPRLMASSDSEAAETASRFSSEMGGLAEVYFAFAAKWRTSRAILTDPEGFRRESTAIFAALATRIERENSELYPLVDDITAHSQRAA